MLLSRIVETVEEIKNRIRLSYLQINNRINAPKEFTNQQINTGNKQSIHKEATAASSIYDHHGQK